MSIKVGNKKPLPIFLLTGVIFSRLTRCRLSYKYTQYKDNCTKYHYTNEGNSFTFCHIHNIILSFVNYGTSLLAYNICVKWERPSFSQDIWYYLAIIRSNSWVVWWCCTTNKRTININNVLKKFSKLKFIFYILLS